MNNREIAQQLFETKFIKALYQTNLDRSLLNRIIAEELIRESDSDELEDTNLRIDSLLSDIDKDVQAIKKQEEDPILDTIEIFMLAAKVKVVYVPKFEKIQSANPDFIDDTRVEKLNKYVEIVEGIADRLGGGSPFSFKTFELAIKGEVDLGRDEIVRKLKTIDQEQLKEVNKKLQSTAVKIFNDIIRDIDKEEKSGEITDKSSAISEIRKIVNKAKRSLNRIESFPEEAKTELGDKFNEYGKLKFFVENKIPEVVAKIKQFLSDIADRKDQIQSDIANLRSLEEDMAAEIPESIKEIIAEWRTLETEISEVFDAMTDKDLYAKGAVDEEGKDSLPSVSMKEGSLAEMLAYALVYGDDDQVKKIYDSIESEGVGIFKSAGAAFKKAFNEVDERETEGPLAAKKRIKYQKSKKLFSKFEAEIGLAIATAVLEKEPKSGEEGASPLSNFFDDEELKASERFKGVKLEFSKSELARNKTSIKILKQFMRNKRKLSGIAYQIEMKLRKGEWNSDVFKSLLDTVKPMGDLHKVSGGVFAKPLNKFLKQIYMVDGYDGFDVEARMQKDKQDELTRKGQVDPTRAKTKLTKSQQKSMDKFVQDFSAKEKEREDEKRQEDWIEDNPFLPKDAESEITKSGKKQQKDREEKEKRRVKKARDSMDYHPSNPDRLGESIEKLIYLMLNEYKQKMEP